jgi:mono/diheme cytochrome c family protein
MHQLRLAMILGLALAACTGPKGPAGSNGTNGMDGTNGMNGTNGTNGSNGIVISDEAKHGLDISFFPIDTSMMDGPTIEKVGRGSYLVNAVIDCSGCHTADPTKPLAGGVQFPIDAAGDFVYSRNLTSDPTSGLMLTEDQFVQVFQTGKDFKNGGQLLFVMAWPNFRWMAVDDIKAIYAYIKLVPPVMNMVGPDSKGPAAALGPIPLPSSYNEGQQQRLMPPDTIMGQPVPDPGHVQRGLAVVPLNDPSSLAFMSPTDQVAFGRGSYLVNAAACNDCHTNNGGLPRDYTPGPNFLHIWTDQYLAGGAVFALPPGLDMLLKEKRTMSKNLLGAENGFFNEPGMSFGLFEGIILDMAHIDDTPPMPLGWPMPADHFRNMSAEDLAAVYTYLSTLASDEPRTAANDKLTQSYARFCAMTSDCDTTAGETCAADGECVGKTCGGDSDCDACQTCNLTSLTCAAADPAGACVHVGM